jgi:large subunit ribosomal protein L30
VSALKITLVRGLVGTTKDQRATVHSLGLRKIRQTVVREDRPEVRGMVQKVLHLVKVEEASQ